MTDIRLVWDPSKGRADIALLPTGQLDTTEALPSWVVAALFSDRLAETSDPVIAAPDGSVDRRGWWADTLLAADHPNDRIGSRVWLLERSKSDRNLPKTAEGYIRQGLQWLLDDGLATALDVRCAFINSDTSMLRADVVIERLKGGRQAFRYDWAWAEIATL